MTTKLVRMGTKTKTVGRKVVPPTCRLCADFGYTLPKLEFPVSYGAGLTWDGNGEIPAKLVFERGVRCKCPAGAEFQRFAEEWSRPV